MKYSNERKQAVLAKLCPPHNRSIREVAAEERISEATLYNWRKQARERGELYPDAGSDAEGWSARDKFAAVLETAAMNESQRGEYCRKRGLYPEQLAAWRRACQPSYASSNRIFLISCSTSVRRIGHLLSVTHENRTTRVLQVRTVYLLSTMDKAAA